MSGKPEITVTVRIEKYGGAPREAVSGHVDGDTHQIDRLVETAKQSAVSLALRSWLGSR